MPGQFREALRAGTGQIGLELSEDQLKAFEIYRRALSAGNKRVNLTAVPEERYLQEHFIDSLTLLQTGKIRAGQEIADIGTGAGFPGVPVKIAVPGIHLHLIESNAKKVAFLHELVAQLDLPEVVVHKARAEEAGRSPELRQRLDVVTARAVAALPVLLEYALPLVKLNGWFLALKGPRVHEEMSAAAIAAQKLGGRIDRIVHPRGMARENPSGEIQRVIVMVEKVRPTPGAYPRRPGIPAKRPLGG